MRLDKYLKNSRLVKRRTLAKEFADAGRVFVNDKIAKSSTNIGTNDLLSLTYGGKILTVRVISIPEIVKKEQAADMYEVISEEKRERNIIDENNDLDQFRDI